MSTITTSGNSGRSSPWRPSDDGAHWFFHFVIARSEATKQSRRLTCCLGLLRYAHNDVATFGVCNSRPRGLESRLGRDRRGGEEGGLARPLGAVGARVAR